MLRSFLSVLLCTVLALSFAACADDFTGATDDPDDPPGQPPPDDDDPPPADAELLYFWLFTNDLPNNEELETIEPWFNASGEAALIRYESALEGYPDTDRDASMERRNRPTEVNYRPEGNNNLSFSAIQGDMRAIQVRDPFEGPNGENTMIFDVPTTGYEAVVFALASKDEDAAEGLRFDYSVSSGTPEWTTDGLSSDEINQELQTDDYDQFTVDFSEIEEANDNPDFKIRIRFDVDDGEANDGNRVTFNNISVDASPLDAEDDPAEPDVISIVEAIDAAGTGETVRVEGIVTRSFGSTTVLQDGTAGIAITNRSELANAINPGDELQVTGPVVEAGGLFQFEGGDLDSFDILSEDNEVPEAAEITLDQLGDFQSQLVAVTDLELAETEDNTFSANTAYDATDGATTAALFIDESSFYVGQPVPTGVFDFTGIVGAMADGPQLLPLLDGDVEAEEVADSGLLYFWFFDGDLPNNEEIEEIEASFSVGGTARLLFESALEGYPDTDRDASMERRNRPTSINYRPEGNNDAPFSDAEGDMRAIQIRDPFTGPNGENTMIFEIPTDGFEAVSFSLAAKDEDAAEGLRFDYSVSSGAPEWTTDGLDEAVVLQALETDAYQLYEVDFSDIAGANDNPDFKVRVRFDVEDGEANEGDRVTFNNVAVDASPLP